MHISQHRSTPFLYRCNHVLSADKLGMFLTWAADAPEEEIREIMMIVDMVEHRSEDHSFEDVSADICVGNHILRKIPRRTPGCHRCQRGIGGNKFLRIGPWSHIGVVIDRNRLEQVPAQQSKLIKTPINYPLPSTDEILVARYCVANAISGIIREQPSPHPFFMAHCDPAAR